MPEQTSATQLDHILYVLPVAARAGGVALDDLTRELGVDRRTLLHSIDQAVTRCFYHPAGSVDAFTITIEQDRVSVHSPREFQRPVRLNAREALALGLGLRMLAAESAADQRALLALAQQLERELQAPEVELQPRLQNIAEAARAAEEAGAAEQAAPQPDAIGFEQAPPSFDVLVDAIERRRVCTIGYLKSGAQSIEPRTIAPLLLILERGRWYLAAHDLDREDRRVFRLDRMMHVTVEDETFDQSLAPNAGRDLAQHGFVFQTDDAELEVTVRYSPRIARWLIEHTNTQPDADGALTLTHRVADPAWLLRHVLQFGEDAEVLAPPEARARVRECVLGLAALHAQTQIEVTRDE